MGYNAENLNKKYKSVVHCLFSRECADREKKEIKLESLCRTTANILH